MVYSLVWKAHTVPAAVTSAVDPRLKGLVAAGGWGITGESCSRRESGSTTTRRRRRPSGMRVRAKWGWNQGEQLPIRQVLYAKLLYFLSIPAPVA